jgi:hypothetical protein
MLTRDELLVEEEAAVAVGGTGPAARATYRLSADGETEFLRLTRDALWQVHPYEPSRLLAGLSFWWALSRAEVLDALAARRAQLEARISGTRYAADDVRNSAGTPEHVVEHFHLHEATLRGELAWVDEVTERVRGGAYDFAGEEPRFRPRAGDVDRDDPGAGAGGAPLGGWRVTSPSGGASGAVRGR